MDQELLMKASLLERNSQELETHLQFINNQITELEAFNVNLVTLQDSSEKEILSSIGKGVYAKANLVDKDLFVEIGAGVIIKKTPQEIKSIIEGQVKTLEETKLRLMAQLEAYNESLQELMRDLEAAAKKEQAK